MKHLYCMSFFAFHDRTGITDYLENKAEKGWMLEKTGSVFWKFRRIEPAQLRFAVTYFPSASAYDAQPSESQLTLRDFCEHTGWHHLSSNAQMQIFYNEDINAVPIETDPVIEIQNIHRSANKTYLPGYLIILALTTVILLAQIWMLCRNPIENLASPIHLSMLLLSICEGLLCGSELILYYRWYKKALRAAEEDGTFTETKDNRMIRIALTFLMLLIILLMTLSLLSEKAAYSYHVFRLLWTILVALPVIIIVPQLLSRLMKRARVRASVNEAATRISAGVLSVILISGMSSVIFKDLQSGKYLQSSVETYEYHGKTFTQYGDTLPLTIGDLTGTDDLLYSRKCDVSSTVFLTLTEACQRPRMDAPGNLPSLDYRIVDVKAPFLYEICFSDLLNEFYIPPQGDDPAGVQIYRYVEVSAEPWNAGIAYQARILSTGRYIDTYLLGYDSKIVVISAGFPITDAYKSVIAAKLAAD